MSHSVSQRLSDWSTAIPSATTAPGHCNCICFYKITTGYSTIQSDQDFSRPGTTQTGNLARNVYNFSCLFIGRHSVDGTIIVDIINQTSILHHSQLDRRYFRSIDGVEVWPWPVNQKYPRTSLPDVRSVITNARDVNLSCQVLNDSASLVVVILFWAIMYCLQTPAFWLFFFSVFFQSAVHIVSYHLSPLA